MDQEMDELWRKSVVIMRRRGEAKTKLKRRQYCSRDMVGHGFFGRQEEKGTAGLWAEERVTCDSEYRWEWLQESMPTWDKSFMLDDTVVIHNAAQQKKKTQTGIQDSGLNGSACLSLEVCEPYHHSVMKGNLSAQIPLRIW